jgi:dolichol kinase
MLTTMPVRSIAHSALALTVAYVAPRIDAVWVYVGLGALALVFVWARQRELFRIFHSVSHRSYGEFFFVAGAGASFFLFSTMPSVWYSAMLIMALADPLAALAGAHGRHVYHIRGERRTVEGTFVCLVVASAVFFVAQVPAMYALLGGIAIACIENLSLRGSDNLTLPVIAGVFTTWFV